MNIIDNICYSSEEIVYAKVSFDKDKWNKTYSFKTIIKNLQRGQPIIVHTINGICFAYFIKYTTKSKEKRKASDWIIDKAYKDYKYIYNILKKNN